MDLTEEEATVFWPLYEVFSTEMAEVSDRGVKLILRYLEDLPEMSDEQALAMLAEDFAIDRERMEVEERYAKTFEHVLPAKKVARLFQIESRLRAVVRMQVLKNIPLVD